MADYECWPLWEVTPDGVVNIDPATLALEADTIARLKRWAQSYDATLDRADPLRSGFASDTLLNAFEREGLMLWWRLQEELGTGFEVLYFSTRFRRLYGPIPSPIDSPSAPPGA